MPRADTENFGETPCSFVAVFFHSKAGELCCRITDVAARETWASLHAVDLWSLIVEGQRASRGSPTLPEDPARPPGGDVC